MWDMERLLYPRGLHRILLNFNASNKNENVCINILMFVSIYCINTCIDILNIYINFN